MIVGSVLGLLPTEGPTRTPRVLLVHMPMADPILPNLGIELLCERLRADGSACDVFYGTLRLPPIVSLEVLHGMVGQTLYAPLYRELDVDEFASEMCELLLKEHPTSLNEEYVLDELHKGFLAAEMNLERCLRDIPVGAYDVVGFSIIFDTQKLPSAALAKRLKKREPHLKVLFGGTGCDGEMAPAVLEAFSEVDFVMVGDADETIGDAVRHATDLTSLAPANLLARPSMGKLPQQSFLSERQLQTRVRPRFDSYVEQRAHSVYAGNRELTLLFEGSRGCWWGDKHHCKFCGIRTVSEGFRQRSTDVVVDEILALYAAHKPSLLYATDAILSREHMRHLLPAIAELRRTSHPDLRLFFEVKSNLSRADVELLASAGVVAVQPGIESFSDSVLLQMDKGASGIRQLTALKWLSAYNIDTIYGLLVGTPGETAADLKDHIALSRRLWHLQPPISVNRLGLHRFSPYFREPGRYGIENLRPFAILDKAYGLPRHIVERLCYELDYDTPAKCDPASEALVDELRNAVAEWKTAFRRGDQLTASEQKEGICIIRRRGQSVSVITLADEDAAVYRAITSPAAPGRIADVTGLADEEVSRVLSKLADLEVAIGMSGTWLGIAVPMIGATAERELFVTTDSPQAAIVGA